MTKEELKLEAIKYLENFKDCANCENRWASDCANQLDEYCLINNACFATPKKQDIYLASAEPREKRIADLEQENAELKKQVRGYLINYSDTNLMKVLRDCIIQNKKLSSQEQNQLSAWVECALDFGTSLDECADQLNKAKEILQEYIRINLLPPIERNFDDEVKLFKRAEQFINEE